MYTRIFTYILALIFFASGGAKLLSLTFEVEAFTRWGYSIAFMYLVGALEFLGAIGLLIPRISALTSLCLTLLMFGAIGTHLVHMEWLMLVIASAITLCSFSLSWSKRTEIKTLLSCFRAH